MTIGSDSLIDFFGTQDLITHATTAGSIADDAFSVVQAADVLPWTNDDDSPTCVMVLKCQWATAPDDGSVVNIHGRKMNIEGTNDSPKPDAANLDQFIGSFTVDGTVATATNTYLVTRWLSLPNHISSQIYDMYFENKSGQTISSGWTAWITPLTKGPHAA